MPHLFPPTKFQTRLRALGYLFVSGVGWYTLFGPTFGHFTGSGSIHGPAAVVWALFMLTAVPTAISVLRGRYRLEFVLLPLFGSALLVAIANVLWRISFEGEHDLIPRTCMALAVLTGLVLRGSQIHDITKADLWTSLHPRR
jgi:MFS family permease